MKIPLVLASLFANGVLSFALPYNHTNIPVDIGHDKAVLLLRDGTSKVVHKRHLNAHLSGFGLRHPTDSMPQCFESEGKACAPSRKLNKRDDAQLIIPLPDEQFLGWDIPMSTITHANEADATVAMAQGQMIANSISVTEQFTATIEEFLQLSTSINYQWTQTATLTGTVTMTIPKNKWGAIVSNPLTYRKRGYVFSGRPGNGQYQYFQADSFTQNTYSYGQNSLSWVKGVVTTCLGDSYPLKRCLGDGVME